MIRTGNRTDNMEADEQRDEKDMERGVGMGSWPAHPRKEKAETRGLAFTELRVD
jgi:hypothetical protein